MDKMPKETEFHSLKVVLWSEVCCFPADRWSRSHITYGIIRANSDSDQIYKDTNTYEFQCQKCAWFHCTQETEAGKSCRPTPTLLRPVLWL
jgi:hypothetical protein